MKTLNESEVKLVHGGFGFSNSFSFNNRGFDFGRHFSFTIIELPKTNIPNSHKDFGAMFNFKLKF